jgi:hypothetical protein
MPACVTVRAYASVWRSPGTPRISQSVITIAHPGQLPGDELFDHVHYDDGSDEKFLRRLWRDLYGDEPLSAPGQP